MSDVQPGQWVLHHASGVVDMVARVYSGEDGDRAKDVDGNEHKVPIVELQGGDTFVNVGDAFAVITPAEVGFVIAAREAITHVCETLRRSALQSPVPIRTTLILPSELRVAQRGYRRVPGSGGMDDPR